MTTALVKTARIAEVELGRYINVRGHAFADAKKVWVPADASFAEMRELAFETDDLRRAAEIFVSGVLIENNFETVPARDAYIEITVPARKGVLRGLIRRIVQIAVFVVVLVVTQGNVALAQAASQTVGTFLGNLLANALVPPSSNKGLETGPQIYTIEGARNQVRAGAAIPIILGRRRVFADIIVPFYQEIIGENIYTIGAVCWACHDIALSDLKYGETPLVAGRDIQIQHSLIKTAAAPTLIPGIVVPSAPINLDLEDTGWKSRITPPNAEQIEVQFYFQQGLGRVTDKGKKKSHSVTIEVRYRAVGSTAWRSGTAATVSEADDVARQISGNSSFTRRILEDFYGNGFLDQYHSGLGTGGSVSLQRTITRSDAGKPFPYSIKFAVPPGVQYEVEVRRTAAVSTDDEYFDAISWAGMNVWVEGNPFPTPELAVTAFRIKAGEQINGAVDTINAIAETLCPVYTPPIAPLTDDDATLANWSGSAPSSNPADLLLFAARGGHTKVPTPDVEFRAADLARFWRSNDDNNYKFDYVETAARRRGDLQQLIAGAGHARALRIGGRFGVVIDGHKPEGNRTILSPDNASNFSFSKIFPSDVHALRVPFTNRETDYRNDQFTLYAPGYGPEDDVPNNIKAAEKFEQFTLPGKVEYADIEAAARRHLLNSKYQTLSGQCRQDIEGRLILRFGDRIGVRHSTIEVSGDSGRITDITKNAGGDITGFKLSESPELLAGETYVARWIKIGTDANGGPYISANSVNHLVPLTVDFGGQNSIHTNDFTFTSPVAANLGPEEGAICVVGRLGQDVIDALVSRLEPIDDEGKSVLIKWVEYAPQRLVGVAAPAHTPLTPPVFNIRPNAVTIAGAQSTDEAINVGFNVVAINGAIITGFQVDFRETPDPDVAGTESAWQERPNAPAGARSIRLPAGRPGQSFDVRIITLGTGGLESDPAILTDIRPFEKVIAPSQLTVTPVNVVGPGGASIPTLAVSVTPELDALIETLIVEAAITGSGAWFSAGSASANIPILNLNGLTPGNSYDVRAAWVNIRGAMTAEAARPVVTNVTVSGDLVASDAAALGGTSAAGILGEIDDNAQAIVDEIEDRIQAVSAEAAARAADLIDEAAARAIDIQEQDERFDAVIASFLGDEDGEPNPPLDFADLTLWTRTISATDKDQYLALLPSEALTVDGVPAYATTAKRLFRQRLATATGGDETITVTARFKALTDGSAAGSTITGSAFYWDEAGTTRVGFETGFVTQKITVADGIVTIIGDLTVPSDARYYAPYFFVNNIAGEDAHTAILDIQYDYTPSLGSVFAAIADEASARTTADQANANQIGVVQATAGAAASKSLENETAIATEQLSTATRFEAVTASLDAIAGQPLNENENFSLWPDAAGLPSNWTVIGGDVVISRQLGFIGNYTLRAAIGAGEFGGFSQTIPAIAQDNYTVKIRLKGVGSDLGDCAVWVRIRDAANGTLQTDQWFLQNIADVEGLVSNAAPDGVWREWHLPVDTTALTAPDNAVLFFYSHPDAQPARPANTLDIDTFKIVAPPAESATVNFLRTALSDDEGNFARAILNTSAGAERAFLEMGSVQRSDGSVDSNVGIGARRFEVSNPVNGVWRKALEIVGGVVTVFGDLDALGAMRFGLRRIAVALQSFRISNQLDGAAISFGGDLTNIPDYEFLRSGLDPLAAGEEYDLTLTSLTSTGAVIRAKIIGGGAAIFHSSSGSVPGVGAEPDIVLDKSTADDATDGNYNYTLNLNADFETSVGSGFTASGQLEFFVRTAGTWTSIGTEFWSDSVSTQGNAAAQQTWSKNFAGPVGQTADQEFGVSVLPGGSITALNSLSVTHSSTSSTTTRTATPGGRRATVTIIPKNG